MSAQLVHLTLLLIRTPLSYSYRVGKKNFLKINLFDHHYNKCWVRFPTPIVPVIKMVVWQGTCDPVMVFTIWQFSAEYWDSKTLAIGRRNEIFWRFCNSAREHWSTARPPAAARDLTLWRLYCPALINTTLIHWEHCFATKRLHSFVPQPSQSPAQWSTGGGRLSQWNIFQSRYRDDTLCQALAQLLMCLSMKCLNAVSRNVNLDFVFPHRWKIIQNSFLDPSCSMCCAESTSLVDSW